MTEETRTNTILIRDHIFSILLTLADTIIYIINISIINARPQYLPCAPVNAFFLSSAIMNDITPEIKNSTIQISVPYTPSHITALSLSIVPTLAFPPACLPFMSPAFIPVSTITSPIAHITANNITPTLNTVYFVYVISK